MSTVKKSFAILVLAGVLATPAGSSAAGAAPAWSIQSVTAPTEFVPGDESGFDSYQIHIANSGGKTTNQSAIIVTDTLPAGLGVKRIELLPPRAIAHDIGEVPTCESEKVGEVSTVTCEVTDALLPEVEPAKLYPGDELLLEIRVATPASATGALVNKVQVKGGGAEARSAEFENRTSKGEVPAGFEEFQTSLTGSDGLATTGADSHPYEYTTAFAINSVPTPAGSSFPLAPAGGDLKEIEVALPPGLAGNPTATERCSAQKFITTRGVLSPFDGSVEPNECPLGSVVGLALVQQLDGERAKLKAPIYNLIPPKGMPAQLGFQPVVGVPVYINTKLRSDGDYGISAYLHSVTEAARVTASRVMIWGTPWEKSHDPMRGECALTGEELCSVKKGTPRPLLRLPSSCQNPLMSSMSFETWVQPPAFAAASDSEPAPLGCSLPPFTPTIMARPTTNVADNPSGLHFSLHLPQKEHEDFEGLGEADLKDARVTLPKGLVVNPSSADGLAACSLSAIGYRGEREGRPSFSAAPADCPDAAKLGSVEVDTPAVDHPLPGSVYLAKQFENPFNSLLAIYVVVNDPESGVVVKLTGRVTPDPVTGQLSTMVEQIPQQPVEDFKLDFFEGSRAPLRTPATCGGYTTTTEMTPWTAPEGVSQGPSYPFLVTSGPQGPCPTGALAIKLSAGLANPAAGAYSPFSLRLTRADGTGEFTGLSATTPRGLSARLAGIPYCPEVAIAQALSRSNPGQGALEAAAPSCPAASQVGTTTAGAGAGPTPLFTSGKVFLAGPYKGAQLSLIAVVPVLAGPFDLGVVVDRVALRIDPETAQVTAAADPLPEILAGVPLDIRDLRVNFDRPNFTLAPTNCEPKSVDVTVNGAPGGAAASTSDRFQVGGCKSLRFKPSLSLRLSGGTRRSDHPALKAVVTYPSGKSYANVARASVALPHSEFLDQAHIRTICTRVQFAADVCPKGSIYGKARATTPLLDKPLEGLVYLRSSSNPLPDLVLALHGQIDAVAVGRLDSHNGGIRASFESVPDVPLSKVVLEMQGGAKGLLVNSRNICKSPNRATARFIGQSGKTYDLRPLLKPKCEGRKRH